MPAGFYLDHSINPGWTLLNGKPTTTIAGPIAVATSSFVTLALTSSSGAQPGVVNNAAEVSAADNDTDPMNPGPIDIGSPMDTIPGNDVFRGDNIVNNANSDEGNHDIASISIQRKLTSGCGCSENNSGYVKRQKSTNCSF